MFQIPICTFFKQFILKMSYSIKRFAMLSNK